MGYTLKSEDAEIGEEYEDGFEGIYIVRNFNGGNLWITKSK